MMTETTDFAVLDGLGRVVAGGFSTRQEAMVCLATTSSGETIVRRTITERVVFSMSEGDDANAECANEGHEFARELDAEDGDPAVCIHCGAEGTADA